MQLLSLTTRLSVIGSLAAFIPSFALGADGVCDANEAADSLCFVSPSGFVVEAVTGPNGEFPIINDNGDSVFSYSFTGPGASGGSCQGVHDISHADILLPSCADSPLTILDSNPVGEFLPGGDPSCGFGENDDQTDVFKWDVGVSCNGSDVFSIVIAGNVEAEPTSFLLKAAGNCDTATILGPACSNVTRYCTGNVNSTGVGGQIDFDGSVSISENNFHLSGAGLPPEQPGFFFFGTTQIDMPFGDGQRCIGGDVTRLRKIAIEVTGTTTQQFDLTLPPLDIIMAGDSYYFQLYYRDPAAGLSGFNTTDALCISFTP
ncbi:MAG: hypothetical protein ACI841_001648 [Planctomycetota bacterium]|jgi:hypothetical protein